MVGKDSKILSANDFVVLLGFGVLVLGLYMYLCVEVGRGFGAVDLTTLDFGVLALPAFLPSITNCPFWV